MDIKNKCNAVKKGKHLFCCLSIDSYSKHCKRRRKCEVQDYDKGNRKLLHFLKINSLSKRSGDGASRHNAPRSNQLIKRN